MCLTEYDHELTGAGGGTPVFISENDLRKHRPCVDSCGFVEVEVRHVRVVQEPERYRPHERRRLPHLRVGDYWARLPTPTSPGSFHTIERIDGETVHWTDGTSTDAREMSDDVKPRAWCWIPHRST